MAKTGITEYDLLISCPGDVEAFVDDIEKAINKFNKLSGENNHIRISSKYWKRDSFPQMGDKPQNIINRQLVNDCDMAIAVFWTRFGTPTDKYGSGTEEEIESMISSGKQVFLYFLNKPCPPSEYSPDFEDVKKFREKCEQKGIYNEVSDEKELSEKFHDHLTRYFLNNKLKERENTSSKNASDGVKDLFFSEGNYTEDIFLKDKNEAIITKIRSIQRNVLPGRKREFNEIPGTVSDAIIYQRQKELITEFAARNGIELELAFWNIGNLKRKVIGGGKIDVEGTEEEIERYDEIQELCRQIKEFNKYKGY